MARTKAEDVVTKWEHQLSSFEELPGEACKAVLIDIINHQRQWLIAHNKTNHQIDEDIVRLHMYQLDLEEERLKYV